MFHVPRYSGGHPRLVLALIFGALLTLAGVVGWLSAENPMHDAALAASRSDKAAPRPPLVVVEDLPQLTERLNREAEAGRFMGGVLVAKGDQVLFRQVYGMANREQGQAMQSTVMDVWNANRRTTSAWEIPLLGT